jgi:hypothetical protein
MGLGEGRGTREKSKEPSSLEEMIKEGNIFMEDEKMWFYSSRKVFLWHEP